MSIEPVSLSNPDPGYHPVTAVVSHVVRLDRDQGYEEWPHGIIANAKSGLVVVLLTYAEPNCSLSFSIS